jgi:hypothetical protein
LTLCAILYDVVAPRKAVIFYHVYGEIALELLLIILWVTSFAGMASYVSQISPLVSVLTDYVNGFAGNPDYLMPQNAATAASKSSCVAIVVLGAVMLYVIHLLYFLSSSRNVHSTPPLTTV